MQQIVIYWYSVVSQHVSGIFMPILRRSDCVPLPIVVCSVVAVVMLESRVARCVHCVENVADNCMSTCFRHLYAHHQEIRLRSTAYSCLSCCSCCDAGESGGKMCALCGECCLSDNILCTVLMIGVKTPETC